MSLVVLGECRQLMPTRHRAALAAMSLLFCLLWPNPVQSWPPGWHYRRSLEIRSPLPQEELAIPFDCQLGELMEKGKLAGDCADLLFLDDDSNPIDFWIEDCSDSAASRIWIELPGVEAGLTRLLMYYGNSLALPSGDGAATFPGFDDYGADGICPDIAGNRLAVWRRHPGNPIITPSAQGLDDLSVRGFAPMIDADGYLSVEDGHLVAYYFAFSSQASEARIFRTESVGMSRTDWLPGQLVLDQGPPGAWDSGTVATGNVIRLGEDVYFMDYVGKTPEGYYGIGIATSNDGIHWQKHSGNPVLTEEQFLGVQDNPVIIISIPYVIRLSSGLFAMGLEGVDPNGGNKWLIHMATSENGLDWLPLNGGRPVLRPVAGRWDERHVANPKLMELSPGDYLMGYNGGNHQDQLMLGFARSFDLLNWTRYERNPVLSGTEPFDQRRIEDAVLIKDDLGGDEIGMYYFGCNDACNAAGTKIGAVIEYASADQASLCASSTGPARLFRTEHEHAIASTGRSGAFSWLPDYGAAGHLSEPILAVGARIALDLSVYFTDESRATLTVLDESGLPGPRLTFNLAGNPHIAYYHGGLWHATGLSYDLFRWNELSIVLAAPGRFDLCLNGDWVYGLDCAGAIENPARLHLLLPDSGRRDLYLDELRVRIQPEGSLEITLGEEEAVTKVQPWELAARGLLAADLPRPGFQAAMPNPFAASTRIRFYLEAQADVSLAIFDPSGRRIRSFALPSPLGAGSHSIDWDGRDDERRAQASGVYFCRLDSPRLQQTLKLTLVR